MSEKQSRGIGDLSKYDAMTTEELEEILRLDAEAPEEQESDIEMILYIMEVLTERKRNNSHTGKTALEAYESFVENYMPETEDATSASKRTVPFKRSFPRWLRSLTAAAAVLVILVLGTVTAKAFGINVWKAMVKWTQDTFQLGAEDNSEINNDLPYTSLQEALQKGKVNTPLAPKWFPDGYNLVDITVERSPLQNKYRAKYVNGEQVLRITVQEHLDKGPSLVEQSDGLVEEYEVSGITYYLVDNNKRTQAVWIIDSIECRITGELTIDELKLMIDSITKG